jgi:alkylation response protein AidB-like acyl-CoA dehydrogenase
VDFRPSSDQQILAATAREFLKKHCPSEVAQRLALDGRGLDPALWRQIAELGWTGLSVPEEAGGVGMTFLEEAVLFEELGYGLFPGPFFSTIGLALPALRDASDRLEAIVSGEATATLAWAEEAGAASLEEPEAVHTEARHEGDGWRLTGTKYLVPDLDKAGEVVVVARSQEGPGLWAVDLGEGGPATEIVSTMDETRRLGRLRLEDTPAERLVEPGSGASVLRSLHRRALAALALEAVGVGQRALELAVDYAKERKQFDKPIGTYQAVSHTIADAYIEVELARSLAYWAAWCVSEGEDQAAVAAPAAKGYAAEAAVDACERSIQVHGGIGFTQEHVLHRFYKRAQWIAGFSGSGSAQRRIVASSLLDG